MRCKRVCFFSHESSLGGAERALLELAGSLKRTAGAEVLVVSSEPGPLLGALEGAGVRTLTAELPWWCDLREAVASDWPARLSQGYAKTLELARTAIQDFNPDVIVSSSIVFPWGAVCAAVLGKPHVWYVHEYGERDHEFRFARPLPELCRYILESSGRVLTCSDSIRKELFNGSAKTKTLYYGIADPLNGRAPVRDDVQANELKVLVVGYIKPSKGQLDVVKALGILRRKGLPVQLVLIGPQDADYVREIKECAIASGSADHLEIRSFDPHVIDAAKAFDVIVTPSRNEGFGRVTLEGLVLGKAVVGSRSGGTAEILHSQEVGLLYSPGDSDELAAQIEFLYRNPEIRRRRGEAGRRYVLENFSAEKFLSGFVAELENAARDPAESNRPEAGQFWAELFASYLGAEPRIRLALAKRRIGKRLPAGVKRWIKKLRR